MLRSPKNRGEADDGSYYIDLNFDLLFVDRTLLKLCVTRAHDEQKMKATDASETIAEKWFGKLTYTSIFATVIFKVIGYLIPIAIYLAIDVSSSASNPRHW